MNAVFNLVKVVLETLLGLNHLALTLLNQREAKISLR
jgi:hypothetical protein